jgi:dTDP-6-deoxy-L-talose 4-dehydrogenase (NAD+)
MKILVTGATGFLGRALCHKLLERGHELLGLSRTGNFDSSYSQKAMTYVRYNMGEELPLDVIAYAPEALVHLAWDGIPDFSRQKCVENVESQLKFLKETEKLPGLEKVVGAGTCREYGAKQGACQEGERFPPDSYFSWAKQSLRDYFALDCRRREMCFVWFRIYYVYGPGQRAESLTPMLIKAFRTNKPPEISNPAAANDYIYVDDVINAFVKAVEDENCDGVFNLGSGKTASIAEISGLVERVIRNSDDFSSKLIKKVASIKSGSGMWADITLSERELGWAPQVLLVDGINRTIDGVCDDGHS